VTFTSLSGSQYNHIQCRAGGTIDIYGGPSDAASQSASAVNGRWSYSGPQAYVRCVNLEKWPRLAQSAATAESDCYDILQQDPGSPSGLYYVLSRRTGGAPKRVYCEMQIAGGGWTVMSYLKKPGQWDLSPDQDSGVPGALGDGWSSGEALTSLDQELNERLVVYLALVEDGLSQGTQWMKTALVSADGSSIDPLMSYASIEKPNGPSANGNEATHTRIWSYADSYGYTEPNAGYQCSHGCTSYRKYGMFRKVGSGDAAYHGTQGADNGCRDGNNICWARRSMGCNVGSRRCAYLTDAGEGVIYAYRYKPSS